MERSRFAGRQTDRDWQRLSGRQTNRDSFTGIQRQRGRLAHRDKNKRISERRKWLEREIENETVMVDWKGKSKTQGHEGI